MRQIKNLCILMLLTTSKAISQELSYDNFPKITNGIGFDTPESDILNYIIKTKARIADLKSFSNGICTRYENGTFEGYKMSHKLDYEEFCSSYQGKLLSYKLYLHIPKDSTGKHIQLMGQFSKIFTERFGAREATITFNADTTQAEQILELQKAKNPFESLSFSLLWHVFKNEDMLEYRSCNLTLSNRREVAIISFWCDEAATF